MHLLIAGNKLEEGGGELRGFDVSVFAPCEAQHRSKFKGKKQNFTPEVGPDCGRCQTECLRREVTESGEPIRTRAPFCLLSGDSRLRARAAFRENHGNKSRRSANMDEV